MEKKEAEDSLLREMLERHAQCERTDDMADELIVTLSSIEEIRQKMERASALSPSSLVRTAKRFLNETDPELN